MRAAQVQNVEPELVPMKLLAKITRFFPKGKKSTKVEVPKELTAEEKEAKLIQDRTEMHVRRDAERRIEMARNREQALRAAGQRS